MLNLSPAEKTLLRAMLRTPASKARWRKLMLRRDRYAERMAMEGGTLLARVRAMVHQQLMALSDGATDEQKAEWAPVVNREAGRMARLYVDSTAKLIDG